MLFTILPQIPLGNLSSESPHELVTEMEAVSAVEKEKLIERSSLDYLRISNINNLPH